MAHRKNVKRIDPRYFLNETVERNDDGSALEEASPTAGPPSPMAPLAGSPAYESERVPCDKLGRKRPDWIAARKDPGFIQRYGKPCPEEALEEEQGIFAPNHYCVHHGGVQHEGKIKFAEAINHNFNRKLNRVTHYDMKLQDGTILEAVAAEDIQVVRASLAEEHSHEEDCPSEEDGEKEK